MVSVRDFIVSTLSARFPLSVKQLVLLLQRERGLVVSYQAVHKALKQLLREGILAKSENKYLLSMSWFRKRKGELDAIEAHYFKRAPSLDLPQQTLFFDSLFEVDKFLIGSFVSIASRIQKKPVLCLLWNHFWIPLFVSRKEYARLRDFVHKVNAFCISKGDSAIDKWCGAFWKKHGWKHKTGAGDISVSDIVVFGDYVIQVFYPEQIRKEIDKVYSQTRKISNLDIDGFFHKIFEKKTRIPVLITKSADLTGQLSAQIKNNFSKTKRSRGS